MSVEILTKEDLSQFKEELLVEIQRILRPGMLKSQKEWLKSYEVRKILNISPGTLQTLRINGTLQFTKIGGSLYYKYSDIIRLFETDNNVE
ncbi:transcriptional regulator [Pedobacter psychrophilus]|uniref:Transcriptional regulator n=1 Tax=Pedobacter psychrophilus TaxID=1826909 RepID=A0A179DMX2_9SPHI|nr:helix-turn-helix domain-containing protein [Pedobacter psychrophilus]OAQ42396.1 transcriptional regulator [Pedobacter psychrophilus]